MKKVWFLLFLIFTSFIGYSQQLPQTSQFDKNKFFINPAVAGSESYLEAVIDYRNQWASFKNAPTNEIVSVQSSFNRSKSGFGGYIFNFQGGPVRNTGLSLAYAYKIKVTYDATLSLGLGVVLAQFVVDGRKLILYDEVDPLIDLTKISSVFYPEFNFGMFLNGKLYYLGISALNIINNQTKVFPELETGAIMPRSLHLNLIGKYIIRVDRDFSIVPSVLINKVIKNPLQLTINAHIDYKKSFNIGMGYRTGDALIFLMGVTFLKDFNFTYTYDIQFSKLSGYTGGSHEFTISYRYFYNALSRILYEKKLR